MRPSRQGSTKPRQRLGAAVSAVLAVYLTTWLGLLPVFQVVHLGLAGHEHFYCADHDQFEDVQRDSAVGDPDAHSTADRNTADTASLKTASGPSPQRHVACTVLNLVTSRNPMSVTSQLALDRHPDQRCTLASVRLPEFTASPLLLAAPKTSPPGRAA